MRSCVGAFLAAAILLPVQGQAQGWFGAPIERQRIAPEPTPGLTTPPVPGRQTIVLRDYAGSHSSRRQPLPPVVMHIPAHFFARTSSHPHEVWGINLPVRYPEMRPLPERERTCRGYCGGYMHLSLENTSSPHFVSRARDLHADVARQAVADDPLVVYTPREPPLGYAQAHDQTYVKRRPPETRRLYVKANAAGEPIEFVDCAPEAPSPNCAFIMPLDGLPQVEVRYSISMEYWDRRDEARAAVQRFVRSFLQPLPPATASEPR